MGWGGDTLENQVPASQVCWFLIKIPCHACPFSSKLTEITETQVSPRHDQTEAIISDSGYSRTTTPCFLRYLDYLPWLQPVFPQLTSQRKQDGFLTPLPVKAEPGSWVRNTESLRGRCLRIAAETTRQTKLRGSRRNHCEKRPTVTG